MGATVRIYFGVGCPNCMFSFHVIGEIFDRVYLQGSLTSPPIENVTTVVTPGGRGSWSSRSRCRAASLLVDQVLSRAERGLAGHLFVEGDEQPNIFASLDPPAASDS